MRRLATVMLFAVLLVGCAAHEGSSGGFAISGTVLAGPACPVARADSPCPPRPWTGTVRATAADGTTHDAETDGAGMFSIAGLPPGTYTVAAVTSGLPRAVPLTVTIRDASRTVALQVDTGIR